MKIGIHDEDGNMMDIHDAMRKMILENDKKIAQEIADAIGYVLMRNGTFSSLTADDVLRAFKLLNGEKNGMIRMVKFEPAPVEHGHWIKKINPAYSPFDDSPSDFYVCSECGEVANKPFPFSHCGAKMEENWKNGE